MSPTCSCECSCGCGGPGGCGGGKRGRARGRGRDERPGRPIGAGGARNLEERLAAIETALETLTGR